MNYNKAYGELLKLVDEIEDDAIQLDALAGKVKQARELIEYCENSLRGIEAEVKDELSGRRRSKKKTTEE